MKITIFSVNEYEKSYLNKFNSEDNELIFIKEKLSLNTVNLAKGSTGCCCFVTDDLCNDVITKLKQLGIQFITLRSAGYDHVNLLAAKKNQMVIMHVPKYSPQSIAEFAVALILAMSRHLIKAHTNVSKNDFTLDSLLGFSLQNKRIGIIGTGNIGTVFARIMQGFNCLLYAYDPIRNEECKAYGVKYTSFDHLLETSDIISLHCPLTPETHHIINATAMSKMNDSVMLINTGRGGLIDTTALIPFLKNRSNAYAGLDVYEHERNLFFQNHSEELLTDTEFLTLQSLPNVLITPHMAFLTTDSVESIASITMENIESYKNGKYINTIFYP